MDTVLEVVDVNTPSNPAPLQPTTSENPKSTEIASSTSSPSSAQPTAPESLESTEMALTPASLSSTQQPPRPLGTAEFSSLPIELRLQIFEDVALFTRDITPRRTHSRKHPQLNWFLVTKPYSPPILHLNREARSSALKSYSRFDTTRKNGKPIYINWSVDRLCFENSRCLWDLVLGERIDGMSSLTQMDHRVLYESLRHLSIGGRFRDVSVDFVFEAVCKLPNLDTLQLQRENRPSVWRDVITAQEGKDSETAIVRDLKAAWGKLERKRKRECAIIFAYPYRFYAITQNIMKERGYIVIPQTLPFPVE